MVFFYSTENLVKDVTIALMGLNLQMQELGLLLCNLTTAVPEGIVVFFSSFDYEGLVYDSWKASGILERILKKKRVFREPRKNTDVESVLKEYKETIDTLSTGDLKDNPAQTGAILFAVVGGKISEGINLSDGMGRCIVMVGLPYPSPSDFELMERVKFIEGLGNPNSLKTSNLSVNDEINVTGDVKAGFDILRSCRHRGKEYYENLCMKAVNQSIGTCYANQFMSTFPANHFYKLQVQSKDELESWKQTSVLCIVYLSLILFCLFPSLMLEKQTCIGPKFGL